MTIKAYIKSRALNNGEFKILIRVYKNGKSHYITTPYSVGKSYFNKKKGVVHSHHTLSTQINDHIKNTISNLYDLANTWEKELKIYTAKDLVTEFLNPTEMIDPSKISFSKYLADYIEKNPDDLKDGTIKYYKTTLRKWTKLFPDVLLDEVTPKIIYEFKNHLRHYYKNKDNTIYNALKTIRKIFNEAIREGLIIKNPMANVKIPKEKVKKSFLSEYEVDAIYRYQPSNDSEKLTKELFLFSCDTGLRISDVYNLKKADLKHIGDKLSIYLLQTKTSSPLSIPLTDRAQEIIIRHGLNNGSKFVFDLNNRFRNSDTLGSMLNKYLKKIAKSSGIDKKISFHTSRHTFITRLINKGIPIYTVSKMAGHKNVAVTQSYANLLDKNRIDAISVLNKLNEEFS